MPIRANIRNGWHSSVIFLSISRSDAKIPCEIGIHVGFGETDDSGREFDEWQAALPHEVVNSPYADVQAPGDLQLGFVVR